MTTPPDAISAFWEYWYDVAQRNLLFWDVLRQRGNNFVEHERAGAPPVLSYEYEVLIEGRTLERPVNYDLLRILPLPDVEIDPRKRPFFIVDPRAGHGPGIGGFKSDSQVGVALRGGFPVYFVTFRPVPEPGQTLEDIGDAKATFIREVQARHPEAPRPCVIGNCQAGWAVAMLAAVATDLTGPIVLNGAPLSYWAGVNGENPLRYLGGIWGGTWVTSFLSDLGAGTFDGANLVANFENLNPANTFWSKQYHLYANIDNEAERYLNFERWWTGFFLLNREEMEFIVDNLFVGNKLAGNQIMLSGGRTVQLKAIKAPIIVFASEGDNITPPQQALNWILDVYQSDQAIYEDRQVIVYTLHPNIGHLGIFVSGRVARREHDVIMGTLEFVDMLPPGLYEMLIDDRNVPDPDNPVSALYEIRFEERSLADIRALDDGRTDEQYFATMSQVSEINAALYNTFGRPWVQFFANEFTAQWLRTMHPLRLQNYLFSNYNPWLAPLRYLADQVREARQPVSEDNPFLKIERDVAQAIENSLETFRVLRDSSAELFFKFLYGPVGLGALFSSPDSTEAQTGSPPIAPDKRIAAEIDRLTKNIDQGGFVDALVRMVILVSRADRDVDPHIGPIAQEVMAANPRTANLNEDQLKPIRHDQFFICKLMPDQAIAALPKLLPNGDERREALDMTCRIVLFDHEPNQAERAMLSRIETALDSPAVITEPTPVVETATPTDAEPPPAEVPEPTPIVEPATEAEPLPQATSVPEPTPDVETVAQDRLTDINGIGQAYQKRLYEAGITTFAALAVASPERLRDITRLPAGRADIIEDWINQARERSGSA